jgi:hypothetical protein
MRTKTLQDWVTVQGNAGQDVLSITQEQGGWFDVSSFAAATFWIDVTQATNSSGSPVTLSLQTSPTLDESYFTPAVPTVTLAMSPTPITVQTVRAPGLAPLARYLRWKVSSGTVLAGGTWVATFRIRVAMSLESFFVPTDLSGCVLWLRGDLGITPNGSAVSGWADQSGNGNNASQSTGTAQPTYKTGVMNGAPALYGDGAHFWMQTSAFTLGANATLFAAAQPAVTPQDGYARLLEHQYDETYLMGTDTTGTQYKLIVNDGSSPFGTAQGGTVTVGANTIVSGLYSSSAGTGGVYVNGVLVGSGTFTAPSSTSLQMAIMQAYNNSGAHFWEGYFGEAIVYNRALATSELARVHRYLTGRYGVVM